MPIIKFMADCQTLGFNLIDMVNIEVILNISFTFYVCMYEAVLLFCDLWNRGFIPFNIKN